MSDEEQHKKHIRFLFVVKTLMRTLLSTALERAEHYDFPDHLVLCVFAAVLDEIWVDFVKELDAETKQKFELIRAIIFQEYKGNQANIELIFEQLRAISGVNIQSL